MTGGDGQQVKLPLSTRPIEGPDERDAPPKVTRACEPCRRKKIKCDSNEICGNCIAYKTECYTTDRVTKKRKPRSDKYIAELEERLIKLEQALADTSIGEADARAVSADGQYKHRSGPLVLRCGHAIGPKGWECEMCGTDRAALDVSSDFLGRVLLGYLIPTPPGDSIYMGASAASTVIHETEFKVKELLENDSFGDMIRQALQAYSLNLRKADAALVKLLARRDHSRPVLPARELCARYIATYFQHTHHIFPLLDKQDFFLRADRAYDATQPFDASFTCIYFSVLAFGAHFLHGQPAGKEDAIGYQFFVSATGLLQTIMYDVTIRTVHAMMLLAMYMENALQHNGLWQIFGQIVRKAQTLGLHRDLPVNRPHATDAVQAAKMAQDEIETRRRTYWMLYIMDNNLTIANGKPCALQDFDCDQAIPVTSNDALQEYSRLTFADGTPFTYLHARIQLARISHQIQQRLFSIKAFTLPLEQVSTILSDLDKKLLAWLQNMPEVFQTESDNASMNYPNLPTIYHTHLIPLLQLHYHNLMITVHRRNLGTWTIGGKAVQASATASDTRCRTAASHAIVLHAARSTLLLLLRYPQQTGDVCYQLSATYPSLSAFVLFANIIHNPGSSGAHDDLEIMKRLIRDLEPEVLTGDGNRELQQEFYSEIARVGEIALAKSHAQGMKRARPVPVELYSQRPPLQAQPPRTDSFSSSEHSLTPGYRHVEDTSTLAGPSQNIWLSQSDDYTPIPDLRAAAAYGSMLREEQNPLSNPQLTYQQQAYPSKGHLDAAPRVSMIGSDALQSVGFDSAFDESLWQMSSHANQYQ